MARWVVLLRGVNVGGVTVRSADLAALLADLGLDRVRTVLATGNAVVDAPGEGDGPAVKARVEAGLRERFGYDAWVVVLSPQRLAEVAAGYPWPRRDDERHPYVVFSSDAAVLADLADRVGAQDDPAAAERVRLAGDVLYWECPRGASTDTPLAKASAAARYKPHLTTRNLRTVEKVLAAATG